MNKYILPIATFVVLMLSPAIPARSQSEAMAQWIVGIETRPSPNFFRYKGAKLSPVNVAKVTVCRAKPDATPKTYEMFWGAKGKTVALERCGKLVVPRGDCVEFKITHQTDQAQYAETQLAVDALLRVVLDLQLNSSPVFCVQVPSDSYQDVLAALQEHNFLVKSNAPETPLQTSLIISVVDDKGCQRADLFYPYEP